jgi:hypothetical protein
MFDRGEGFFLGPLVVNYTVTVFCFILPVLAAYSLGQLGDKAMVTMLGSGAIFLPVLLYHWSWRWWLTGYFYFLPHKLTANRENLREDLEE